MRVAAFDGPTLLAAVFIAPSPVVCDRTHIIARIAKPAGTGLERMRILAGRPGAAQSDPGPVICACLGVGRNQILVAIARARGACSVDVVGSLTGAGTNCGSCRAEIGGLIHAIDATKAD